MGFDRIGLAPRDVYAAAAGCPSRDAGSVVLVGVGDTLVILFAVFVLFRVRVGVAAAPEILDEVLTLLVGGQSIERPLFFLGDDVSDVGVAPFLISLF